MLIYSVILFLAALVFAGMGVAIYMGKTALIHDYHQTKIKDKPAYGRAFGKVMIAIAFAFLLSAVLGLFDNLALLSVAVLVLGIVVGIGLIAAVQRKYNKGLF